MPANRGVDTRRHGRIIVKPLADTAQCLVDRDDSNIDGRFGLRHGVFRIELIALRIKQYKEVGDALTVLRRGEFGSPA
jgi:hypothetical protein